MNYLREVLLFQRLNQSLRLSAGQISLWYALMAQNNQIGWNNQKFTVSTALLKIDSGLSESGIQKAREALIEHGLLKCTKATRRNDRAVYQLVSLASFFEGGLSKELDRTLVQEGNWEDNRKDDWTDGRIDDRTDDRTGGRTADRNDGSIDGWKDYNKINKNIINIENKKGRGYLENVFLTDQEVEELDRLLPDLNSRLRKMGFEIMFRHKTYPDHYQAILHWGEDDEGVSA